MQRRVHDTHESHHTKHTTTHSSSGSMLFRAAARLSLSAGRGYKIVATRIQFE